MKKMTAIAAALLLASTAAFAASHKSSHAPAAPTGKMVQTDTKVTHDVSRTDKMGTTNYGSVTHTQTTPEKGTRVISQKKYHHHTPSEMARANEKKGELSLGVGGSYSFAKDNYGTRLSDMGVAGNAQLLWRLNPHLAIGLDYTMMAPQPHGDLRGGDYQYDKLRAHHISLAGKYTINAWDKMNVYIPMGVGASHLSLKGSGTRDGIPSAQSESKWGMGFYIGLGTQYNLTKDLFMGLEYRYHMPFVNGDDLNRYGRDRSIDFHSAMLRMGMRF